MWSASSAGEGFGLSIIPKFALYREDYQVHPQLRRVASFIHAIPASNKEG